MSLKNQRTLCPFLSSKLRPKKGRKHLPDNQQQTLLRAAKVLFTTKTNGFEKLKNMKASGYE